MHYEKNIDENLLNMLLGKDDQTVLNDMKEVS